MLTRRAFLKLTLMTTAETAALGIGGFTYTHGIEPGWLDIEQVRLTLPRLTPAFDGYRIAQISDIHISEWMTRERLADIVAQVNEQKPDLIVLTGDYVHQTPELYVDDLVIPLSQLRAPDGVLSILGNHDHWTDAALVRRILHEAGTIHLDNDVLALERGAELLYIAGVDDIWEQQDRLDLVLERLPDEGAAILLAHEPDYADTSAATGRFDLQISGHSHGGQVNLPLLGRPVLPYLAEKYPAGRYQVGSMIQYTNRGVGMIMPRVRFNCRPEITVFTLSAPTKRPDDRK
jgi:predicted MPP superfamily phosphohydrolase